jgi:hypothetical protein
MRIHHSKTKGDAAVAAVIFDLTKIGYIVSAPMSEHAAYDLIVDTGKLFRLQVKLRANGHLPTHSMWSDKNGHHRKAIADDGFDFFAIVSADYSKIAYCPIEMAGCNIRFEIPQCWNEYYFWEDFKTLEVGLKPKRSSIPTSRKPYPGRDQAPWPTDDALRKMMWDLPAVKVAENLGISDSAILKRCKRRGIPQPPRGYWITKGRRL